MTQKSLSPHPRETDRKSGTLNLFLLKDPEAVSEPPYARFRLCRGFIDDLNRILPIRLRIQLEGELAEGKSKGRMETPSLRFHWEFSES